MRILHVIGSLQLGGAQVLLKHLAEQQSRRPDCRVLIYPLRQKKIEIPIDAEVAEADFPHYDPRKFFKLMQICRENQIDILHAHLYKPILSCLLAGERLGIPVVVHEHGPIQRRGVQYAAYRTVLKHLGQKAAAIIAISDDISRFLQERIHVAPDKIRLIHNAVDFSAFDRQILDRRQAKQALDIDPGRIVLGFAGRLHPVKGVDIAVKALALLKEKYPGILFLLIGAGGQRKHLENLACREGVAGNVRFLGFQEEMAPLMAAVDAALVPSRQEPFGLVGLEWMRMKVPVVTSGVGGIRDYVTDRRTGLITPRNDPADIAAGVETLLNNPQLNRAIVAEAYEITKAFEIESYTDKICRLYQSLLPT